MDPAKKENVNQLQQKKTREPPAASNENGFSTDLQIKETATSKSEQPRKLVLNNHPYFRPTGTSQQK